MTSHPHPEPYKIKVVEPIRLISREEREKALAGAGYNTFLLDSRDVYIDLLTDSGTSAMSDSQWAGMMVGDESYAGSVNFHHLEESIGEVMGYEMIVPTHQGRAAEHICFKMSLSPGQVVPMNMYFTTTRHHLELAGGIFRDVICREAHDPQSIDPFKGNVDLDKLNALFEEVGRDRLAMVVIAPNVNMAGGQPFSLANLKEVWQWCQDREIKLFLDATRIAENAYFIVEREEAYRDWTPGQVVKEICRHSNGCWMSAKKDGLVNIGGFLAFHKGEEDLYKQCRNEVVVYEGLHTYGGLAGRDMEALARGLREVVDHSYLQARISQVEFLHSRLCEGGVPVVHPCGGHGVFLDATRFLFHLDQEEFPGQMLSAQIYLEGGIRSMERGIVSAGRDPETGENCHPQLELVRLTIPRRVYTETHMNYVADTILELYRRRESIGGLEMTYEPKKLRFFQARFEPVGRPHCWEGS